MQKTRTYTIYITKTSDGYRAVAPAFPDLTTTASGSRRAYSQVKDLIKARLSHLFSNSLPIPKDPVIQTRTLRLDLTKLREKEELR